MCDVKFSYIITDINIQQCTFLTLQAKGHAHVKGSQNGIGGVIVSVLSSCCKNKGVIFEISK